MTSILTPAARRIALPCLAAGALAFGLGLGPIAALAAPGDTVDVVDVAENPTIVVEEAPVVVDALDGYQLPTLDAPPASAPVSTTSGPSAEFTATTGRIFGVVTDNSGTPLESAQVIVFLADGLIPVEVIESGPFGQYVSSELAIGEYYLYAVADGHLGEWWSDVTVYTDASAIAITGSADIQAPIGLAALQQLIVDVRYIDGTPVPDALIYAHYTGGDGEETVPSATDASGQARSLLLPYDHTLEVRTLGGDLLGWYDGDTSLGTAGTPFAAVADGDPIQLEIVLPYTAEVDPDEPVEPWEPGEGDDDIEVCEDDAGQPIECGALPETPETETETVEETDTTQLDTLALTGASMTPAAVGAAAAIALTGVVLLAARKTRRASR